MTVEWFKDGTQLLPDERFVYKSDTVFEIRGVMRTDEGMYQCFVSDDSEEIQAAAQLLLGGNYSRMMDGFFSH